MSVTAGQIVQLLDQMAPFEGAEPWDNVGLLAGRWDAPVDCVLCALDLTQEVLAEAIDVGAQMIVTHHPILFRGRKNLREDDSEGRLLCALVRSGLAMAAVHTNFDNVHPGVNDALAQRLELKRVEAGENGMCIGEIDGMTLEKFAQFVSEKLGGPVRRFGSANREIHRVAVLGGSGGEFVPQAMKAGADVYITGEISYHVAMTAADDGLCILEAGHEETEKPSISLLTRGLQTASDDVQYKIRVLCSAEKRC